MRERLRIHPRARAGMLLVLGVWMLGYAQGRADGRHQGTMQSLTKVIDGLKDAAGSRHT